MKIWQIPGNVKTSTQDGYCESDWEESKRNVQKIYIELDSCGISIQQQQQQHSNERNNFATNKLKT